MNDYTTVASGMNDWINSTTSMYTDNQAFEQLEPCYILRPLGYYLFMVWILGTALNGSMFYIIVRYKKLRESPTNILIGGLIVADLIGAFFEVPLPAFSMMTCRFVFLFLRSL